MTRQECNKLIMAMMAIYATHFPKPEESLRLMSNGWYLVMEDMGYDEAMIGLKWFARMDPKGFPPAPGQIIQQAVAVRGLDGSGEMDEAQAWDLCERALSNSSYHAEEEFEKLPPLVRRAVGSPEAMKQMAMEDKVAVTKAMFLTSYRNVLLRHKAEASAPWEARDLMKETEARRRAIQDAAHQDPVAAVIRLSKSEEAVEAIHNGEEWEWVRGQSTGLVQVNGD